MGSKADSVKAGLRRGREDVARPLLYVSTGSTQLDLACTGRVGKGLRTGHYYFFVGDSSSGKTWVGMSVLAEASVNPAFDGYRLIYDGPEGGALMDIRRFFGERLSDRMEPPAIDDGQPVHSRTAQQLYFHLDDAFKDGRPFIYVQDSQDALSSDEEIDKFDERKKAAAKGKEVTGTYGDSKAKIHSQCLRQIMTPLADTGSILLILNQTRDSFDMFEKKTYSGGRALLFYATLQLWSRQAGHIERTVQGKKRELGVFCSIRVKKNRITGRDRTVKVPIHHSHGIDDVLGMVMYLEDEGFWKNDKGKVTVTGLGPEFVGSEEQVVRRIEQENMEGDLKELVQMNWDAIEKACSVVRKSRY